MGKRSQKKFDFHIFLVENNLNTELPKKFTYQFDTVWLGNKGEIMAMDREQKKGFDRRRFLKVGGAGLALLALEGHLKRVSPEEILPKSKAKRRYAMVIDLRRCIGCESCTVACKVENNIPPDNYGEPARKISWNEVIFKEEGRYPFTKRRFWPRPCMHCENPPCTKVCPVRATYKDEERGLVLQRYERCIGCRYCAVACPYGARYFNWSKPSREDKGEVYFNPDVEIRNKGVVEKCLFCVHLIKKAEEMAKREKREIEDGEIKPACVLTCMGNARFFGDLNDPESQVSKLLRSGPAFRFEEYLGTEPKVFYLLPR